MSRTVLIDTDLGDLSPVDYLEIFCQSYIETALWSCPAHGHMEDDGHWVHEPDNDTSFQSLNFDINDLDVATITELEKDCLDFVNAQWDILRHFDPRSTGHDFWLTRNHHGAGFWDGDYPKDMTLYGKVQVDAGEALTAASHPYGNQDLYADDTGRICAQ